MFIAVLLIIVVSISYYLGHNSGYRGGFLTGADRARELEMTLLSGAITKLSVQDRYRTLDKDLTEQYKTELNIIFEETVSRER